MQERQRPPELDRSSGAGWDDMFGGAAPGLVAVQHGPYAEQIPVAGMTVAEVRERFADHFGVGRDTFAVINGARAEEDTVLREGEALMFMRGGGVKGAVPLRQAMSRRLRSRKVPVAPAREASVTIEGETIRTTSPDDGAVHGMKMIEWMAAAAPPRPDTCGVALPPGTRFLYPRRRGLIVVHETPPRVHHFTWIASDSVRDYGDEASYRQVSVALPYVVLFASLDQDRRGRYGVTSRNECFVRNAPLRSEDDLLCYPPLLNCSKMNAEKHNPLAWVCTQYLAPPQVDPADPNCGLHTCLQAVLHHLFETGFNYSSEHHELSSWYSETREAKVDPRLETIESWEEASRDDPCFALDVPWLETGQSVKQIAERMQAGRGRGSGQVSSATDVARLILNQRAAAAPPSKGGDSS